MIGLIFKDFSVMKKQFQMSFLIMIFYIVFSIFSHSSAMVAYMILLLGLFIPITTIGYDERCEWNKYAACMPIKKSYLATSKYLLSSIAFAIGTIIYYVIEYFTATEFSIDTIKNGLALLSAGILVISIYLPVVFKFGVEKSRYFIIAIFMIPSLFLLILEQAGINVEPSESNIQLIINFIPFVAVIALIFSILISANIIKNKEF